MASSLIDSMTVDFDPSLYRDGYRDALEELVAAKVQGHEVVRPQLKVEEGGGSLADALKASLAAAKAGSAGPPTETASARPGARPAPDPRSRRRRAGVSGLAGGSADGARVADRRAPGGAGHGPARRSRTRVCPGHRRPGGRGRRRAAAPSPDLALGSGCLVPGLIDLQVNGYFGVDLAEPDAAGWGRVVRRLPETGTTAFLPTFITAPVAELGGALRFAAGFMADPPTGARVLGVHAEGPFLAPGRAGAHRRDRIVPPSPEAVAGPAGGGRGGAAGGDAGPGGGGRPGGGRGPGVGGDRGQHRSQ